MRQEAGADKLVALVADRDIEEALTKLFRRTAALGVGELRCDITKHPGRDAGCMGDATNFLRQFLRTHRYGLVVFDRYGCGSDASREEIEAAIEGDLSRNGWEHRARAVVIDPELEQWVWSSSPAVSAALGWGGKHGELRSWLAQRGLWDDGLPKPSDPKRAMIQALQGASRATRRRRSARIFGEIAASVSVEGCEDPAFRKLLKTLRGWFPSTGLR